MKPPDSLCAALVFRPGSPARFVGAVVISLFALGCGGGTPAGHAPTSAASRKATDGSSGNPSPGASMRSTGYVGSEACGRCHAEVSRAYHGHPMSRSLAEASNAPEIEDYEQAAFALEKSLIYYAEKTATGIVHHEQRVDAAGEVLYDQAVPVAFAVGSGARGRSYLINDEGRLYASPISWYSNPKGWGLSPGYGPDHNPRFERRVTDGCLACHVGRIAVHGSDIDRFAEPPLLEAAIGCERCHGPGEGHVAYQSGTLPAKNPDPIVNPARLTDARRDAVCNQCHLQGRRRVVRSGRTEFDFQPGMFLSDNWVIFLKTAGVKDGTAAAVSQVEQMYASRCYQQSQGALACISCHGGHDVPTAGQAGGVFREKCLSCHTGDAHGCAADLAHRQAVTAEDSCIVCHMPKFPASDVHASQTDHRILRRASAGTDVPAEPVAPRDLKPVLFNEPGAPVDGPEWGRARGIYLAERAAANRNTEYAKEAVELLAPTVNESPNDVEGRYLLGRAYMVLGQSRRAIRTWEKVLAIQPRHEDVLEALAAHYHEANDLAAARRYYERLLEVNPGRSQYYGRLAHVLGQLGDLPRAIELAEKCLELNPSLMQTHAWLVEACLMNGDQPRAAAHAAILKRFQPAAEKTK